MDALANTAAGHGHGVRGADHHHPRASCPHAAGCVRSLEGTEQEKTKLLRKRPRQAPAPAPAPVPEAARARAPMADLELVAVITAAVAAASGNAFYGRLCGALHQAGEKQKMVDINSGGNDKMKNYTITVNGVAYERNRRRDRRGTLRPRPPPRRPPRPRLLLPAPCGGARTLRRLPPRPARPAGSR